MTEPVSLGPWRGVDNRHSGTYSAFQPSEDRPAAVEELVDFYLDNDGWPVVRSGLVDRVAAATGLTNIHNALGTLVVQDGAKILKINTSTWGTTELVTGLDDSSTIEFYNFAAQTFYTDGTSYGRIVGGSATNWGCSIGPTPTLAEIAGTLPAGRYHVALEPIDGNGLRHAANLTQVVTTTAAKALRVSVSGVDSNATHLRVYLAGPNDDVLYRIADVAVGSFPYDITALPTEDTVCKSIGLSPPPAHDFAFSYQNWLMLVDGQWIYPSLSAAAHLYDLSRHVVGRPETITAAGGLPDGFWTVSTAGAYWAEGQEPTAWRQWELKHPAIFTSGSYRIHSGALSFLGIPQAGPIVLFWSSWGLAVGLSSGQMIFPMQDRYYADVTGMRATFGFIEQDGTRLLVVNLV